MLYGICYFKTLDRYSYRGHVGVAALDVDNAVLHMKDNEDIADHMHIIDCKNPVVAIFVAQDILPGVAFNDLEFV